MNSPEIMKKYIAFTKKWEGGLSRDKADNAAAYPCPTEFLGHRDWHTNIGITYKTWVGIFGTKNDTRFFAMSAEDWFKVFKTLYWDGVHGDAFAHPSIAIYVTGMAWGSGAKRAAITLQKCINQLGGNVKVDGDIGPKTVAAANALDPRALFDAMLVERERYFRAIAKGDDAKYLKGWLNRLNDYKKTFRP